jgi:hypothetical protein
MNIRFWRWLAACSLLVHLAGGARAQDSTTVDTNELETLLNATAPPEVTYAFATFKSTRVINLQSVEVLRRKHLDFRISHRFGELRQGLYDMFGLDQAEVRIGADYGLTDWATVGFGRSRYQKTWDAFGKVRLLRQSSGARNCPVTVVGFGAVAVSAERYPANRTNYPSSRFAYVGQVSVGRKFNDWFSLQVSPTVVHRNLVRTNDDWNTTLSVGYAGRVKFTKRIALNLEFLQLLPLRVGLVPGQDGFQFSAQNRPSGPGIIGYQHSLSVGLDIETGGHVFQLHVTNSPQMFDKAFFAETNGTWGAGNVHFGFNVSRVFSFDHSEARPRRTKATPGGGS